MGRCNEVFSQHVWAQGAITSWHQRSSHVRCPIAAERDGLGGGSQQAGLIRKHDLLKQGDHYRKTRRPITP